MLIKTISEMFKQIEKSICIEPEYLNCDIKKSLIEKSRSSWVGKCTKEDGYILKINSILGINDNYISPSTTSIVFKLLLNAEVLKPEVGTMFSANITLIHQQGIFMTVQDKMKILIPISNLSSYEFDKPNNCFRKGDVVLKTNDKIDVTITAIRYEKNNFNCIGEL